MKKTVFFVVAALLSLYSFAQISTQKHIERINKALSIGNVEAITPYLGSAVEVSVLNKNGIYSAAQTKNILKNFFLSHKPIKFVILHSSGKKNSKYYIGNLTTKGNKEYRIFYVTKQNKDIPQITQFRIENKIH